MEQNNHPTVSVIMAVYNGEKTIKRAIDSILQQSWPVDEIIIVDDGSVDDTKSIVSEYGDKITYIYQQNSGVSVARNNGVDHASSEWLCFLDADDWYYPDRIKKHMGMILKTPDIDFLTGNFDYIDENGEILRQSMQSSIAGKKLLIQAGKQTETIMTQELLADFIEQHFGDTHTLTVKRTDFIRLGGYPQGFAVCEDVNFLIRLCAMSKKIGVVTQSMAAYFIHSQSATRSNPLRAQLQTLEALKKLKQTLKVTNTSLLNGLKRAIRHARLDLAYTQLKINKRGDALKSVLPLLYEKPGLESIKDILSVGKG